MRMSPTTSLRVIKVVHTVAWAFFAGCILTIPVMASRGRFEAAAVLIGIVLCEVYVLVQNSFVCPLTDIAARYTTDRRDNFDIYLPSWLARHNKTLFGWLFGLGIGLTVALWAFSIASP
jgi:hypothetical protein